MRLKVAVKILILLSIYLSLGSCQLAGHHQGSPVGWVRVDPVDRFIAVNRSDLLNEVLNSGLDLENATWIRTEEGDDNILWFEDGNGKGRAFYRSFKLIDSDLYPELVLTEGQSGMWEYAGLVDTRLWLTVRMYRCRYSDDIDRVLYWSDARQPRYADLNTQLKSLTYLCDYGNTTDATDGC